MLKYIKTICTNSDAFDTLARILPKTRPSGRKACGNNSAAQSAPAHYTAHNLHITRTDSIHWSLSKRYSEGLLSRLLNSSPAKIISKEQNCVTGELQRASICQVVSAALWFAPGKRPNQHLSILFTSSWLLLLWLFFFSSSLQADAPRLIGPLLFDQMY